MNLYLPKPEFKHSDTRRTLIQLVTDHIAQVNVYHVKKGAELGNHYHKETVETFYVTHGKFEFRVRNILGEEKTYLIEEGELFRVFPRDIHTVKAKSSKASMMTFLSQEYSKSSPDIYEVGK